MLVTCTPPITVLMSETTRQLNPIELLGMSGPKLTTTVSKTDDDLLYEPNCGCSVALHA